MIRGNLPKLAWNYLKYLIFETTITYEAEGHKEIIMLFVGLALKMKRESDLIAGVCLIEQREIPQNIAI